MEIEFSRHDSSLVFQVKGKEKQSFHYEKNI